MRTKTLAQDFVLQSPLVLMVFTRRLTPTASCSSLTDRWASRPLSFYTKFRPPQPFYFLPFPFLAYSYFCYSPNPFSSYPSLFWPTLFFVIPPTLSLLTLPFSGLLFFCNFPNPFSSYPSLFWPTLFWQFPQPFLCMRNISPC